MLGEFASETDGVYVLHGDTGELLTDGDDPDDVVGVTIGVSSLSGDDCLLGRCFV